MAINLRQSTASQEIPLGYFVDSTDGNTEETALTIANTDIKIWKTGATTLANKNSGGGTHISNGIYYAVLDATDTDTIGPLVVFVHVSGALAVRVECNVLDEAVYDVTYGTVAPATATNITAGTITTVTNVTTVNGLAANVINAAAIAADAITAAKIADGAIDAATFAANAITATVLAADCITAAKIANSAIDAATFAADVDAEILSYLVDDATRIDASALNTASGTTIPAIQVDTDDIQTRLPAALVSGRMDASVGAMAANTVTAAAIADGAIDRATLAADTGLQSIRSNTAQAGGATTITLDASASASDDFYNNTYIYVTGGTGIGQSRFISDYVGATKVATVNAAWITNPDNTSTFAIIAFSTIPGASAPTAAEVADAVWDEATAGHTTAGTFGEQCKTDIDAILVDTAEIGAAGAGLTAIDLPDQTMNITGNITGNLSGSVGSVTGNVGGNVVGSIGSLAVQAKADVNAEADTAISDAALATAANLATVDTVVDAIKAKTDSLTFTIANVVDSNIQRVNDVTVNGTGAAGDEWGP